MKQEGRRQARKDVEAFLRSFEEHLKPKPKYIPAWLWRFGQRIFIEVQ